MFGAVESRKVNILASYFLMNASELEKIASLFPLLLGFNVF